ncbi:hypothetical protein Acsp02_10760 [Actinoplanes sp. NBRC 103695]|nr:hypothetical protein Acsp02_10760 [Actinoplanes sp. NBRC 103695]
MPEEPGNLITRTGSAMTDQTPRPNAGDDTEPLSTEPAGTEPGHTEPAGNPAAAGPVGDPAAEQPRPSRGRWWNRPAGNGRRVPLAIALVALLLGCMLGGGLVAIGSFAFGHRGDDRGHGRPDFRDGGDRERGDRGRRGDDGPGNGGRPGDGGWRRDGGRPGDNGPGNGPGNAPPAAPGPAASAPAASAPAPAAS